MKRVSILLVLLVMTVLIVLPATTSAADRPLTGKGLYIAPLRQYLSADAGVITSSSFTIANLTGTTQTVQLEVKQFSVANYTYAYQFGTPEHDWIHVANPTVTLQPGQKQKVLYTINVPADGTPGGYYYTLIASANLSAEGVDNTIQVADQVYLTVTGTLIRTSHLQTGSIQHVVFGKNIPFRLQPVNTGNVYFFSYATGQLHGLLTKPAGISAAHLLIPNKVRTLEGAISSPVLPGIYRASYGYRTDAGQSTTLSSWVIFIPPWSIALLITLVLLAGKLISRKKNPSTKSVADHTQGKE